MKTWGFPILITLSVAAIAAIVLYMTVIERQEPERGNAPNPIAQNGGTSVQSLTQTRRTDASYKPPPVQHKELKTFVDRTKTNRIPQDSTVRVQRLTDTTDIKGVIQVLNDRQDTPHARSEAMLYLARSSYRSRLPEHLNKMLHDPSESDAIRCYCVQHLDTLVSQTP